MNNFLSIQVCQNGLEILSLFADRMREDFRPYVQTILAATIDRLGITINLLLTNKITAN